MYALDLLGFGQSDKPLIAYSIEMWKQLVLDFMHDVIDGPAVLVGNSLGSLICLVVRTDIHQNSSAYMQHGTAHTSTDIGASIHTHKWYCIAATCCRQNDCHLQACTERPDSIAGLIMLNCAGGMNNKVR